MRHYLQATNTVLNGDSVKMRNKIIVMQLCSSHYLKILFVQLDKICKGNEEIKGRIKLILFNSLNICNLEEFNAFISAFFELILTSQQNNKLNEIVRSLLQDSESLTEMNNSAASNGTQEIDPKENTICKNSILNFLESATSLQEMSSFSL